MHDEGKYVVIAGEGVASFERLTTTVEADGGLEGDAFLGGAGLDIVGLSGIEGSYVCLVVLRVVKRHDLLRDVGLKGIVGVRERGKTVSHRCVCGGW